MKKNISQLFVDRDTSDMDYDAIQEESTVPFKGFGSV